MRQVLFTQTGQRFLHGTTHQFDNHSDKAEQSCAGALLAWSLRDVVDNSTAKDPAETFPQSELQGIPMTIYAHNAAIMFNEECGYGI